MGGNKRQRSTKELPVCVSVDGQGNVLSVLRADRMELVCYLKQGCI